MPTAVAQSPPPSNLKVYPVQSSGLRVIPGEASVAPDPALIDSIYQHGLLRPMIMAEDCTLLAGVRRLAAMKAINCDDAQVIIVSSVDETLDLVRWLEGRTDTRKLSPTQAVEFSYQVRRAYARARKVWKRDDASAVYRLYATDGQLLYVGVTFYPETRWQQHSEDKKWWALVAQRKVQWFETRTLAEQAEADAIRSEGPLFNEVTPRMDRWSH